MAFKKEKIVKKKKSSDFDDIGFRKYLHFTNAGTRHPVELPGGSVRIGTVTVLGGTV